MALDPNRWTQKTSEALSASLDLARVRNHPELTPVHLVSALVGQ